MDGHRISVVEDDSVDTNVGIYVYVYALTDDRVKSKELI